MAFLELEDRIMRVEAVAFPTIWTRHASLLEPGSLAIMLATVQHQDDDFKLLLEDVVPLGRPDLNLAEQVQRLQRQANSRGASRGAGASAPEAQTGARRNGSGSGAPPVQALGAAVPAQAPARQSHPAAPASMAGPKAAAAPAASGKRQQRMYIKIAASRDEATSLEQLKVLLAGNNGPLETVLFYESQQKTVALSDAYRVKPSVQLISRIEALFGKGSAVVK